MVSKADTVQLTGVDLDGRDASLNWNGDRWTTSFGTAQVYFYVGGSFINPGYPATINLTLSPGDNSFQFYTLGDMAASYYSLTLLGTVNGTPFQLEAVNSPDTAGGNLSAYGFGLTTTVASTSLVFSAFSLAQNTNQDLVSYYSDTPGGRGNNIGNFSLQVNSVPEPTSCGVLGLGVLGILLRRRKA